MKKFFINIAFSLFLVAFVALGCNIGYQTEQANKLVDEANKLVADAKDLAQKTEMRNTSLFSAPIQTAAQLQSYKEQMKDEALDIAADFGKAADKASEGGKKFAEAAKLNLPDKFKEYLEAKSQEFSKRAEAVRVLKGNAQAFVDYDDHSVMTKRFEENNSKSNKLFAEANDLNAKAKKIEDENKDIFKS